MQFVAMRPVRYGIFVYHNSVCFLLTSIDEGALPEIPTVLFTTSNEGSMNTASSAAVAADYMQRDVITVSPDSTLREALELMTGNHITGLPVMDGDSRCIGLITSSDILSYEQDNAGESAQGATADFYDPESQQWETVPISVFGLENFGDVRVRDVMTTELVWVERNTPLTEAARRLLAESVHRVLVLDKNAQLYGVLSAYDFVRVVAGE